MRTKAIIALLSISTISIAAVPPKKLSIQINKNIELLGLAYFIGFEGVDIDTKTVDIAGKTIPKKDWHNYGYYLYQQYKSYATSQNLEKSFSVADHLWLDYIINLLLQVDNAPNAVLKESIDESYYINFSKKKDREEAKRNVALFLEGLNAFYKEVNFDKYLSDHQVFYDRVIKEVELALPKQDFVSAMESFYKKKFDNYGLIPSLTIPKGMGFGLRYTLDGKTYVFNAFGAFDFQQFDDKQNLNMGFNDSEKLRELSVHEFGHSFVNPVVASLPEQDFVQTEKLFEPLKSSMGAQGYNTWKVCLYEHFVRAGEVIIAQNLGDAEEARRLQSDYEHARKFKYLPEIIDQLQLYRKKKIKTYAEAVRKAMETLTHL